MFDCFVCFWNICITKCEDDDDLKFIPAGINNKGNHEFLKTFFQVNVNKKEVAIDPDFVMALYPGAESMYDYYQYNKNDKKMDSVEVTNGLDSVFLNEDNEFYIAAEYNEESTSSKYQPIKDWKESDQKWYWIHTGYLKKRLDVRQGGRILAKCKAYMNKFYSILTNKEAEAKDQKSNNINGSNSLHPPAEELPLLPNYPILNVESIAAPTGKYIETAT